MFIRTELLCPGCEYDVAQTLRDRRTICPECGSEVSEQTCAHLDRPLPRRFHVAFYLAWLPSIPLTPVVFASGVNPLAIIPSVAGLIPVYVVMWRAERWLRVAGAARRALGLLVGVVILNFVLAIPLYMRVEVVFFD